MIVDPWGTVLAKASDRDCVITAEIDFDYLNKVRGLMPCQNHIKLI
jgi:predicted amidohydrolase